MLFITQEMPCILSLVYKYKWKMLWGEKSKKLLKRKWELLWQHSAMVGRTNYGVRAGFEF